jgi:Cna protein B-type domain protein
VAVSGPILVGTYTITEDKSTIPAGYIDGKTIDKVVVKKGKVEDAKSYDYWNYYTEVSLTKVNAARPNIKIDGAVFAVYKDVNGNGTYEADVDKLYDTVKGFRDGHLKSVGDGKYSMSGLEFGKYLIKEIVAPRSNIFKYVLDDTYYPITIDKDHLSAMVANSNHNFSEDFDRCKITLAKRIPLDEIDGNIWYQHGTPIFVLELEDDIGRVYRHSYAFTKDYVDAHTFTENGKKYVEMSYTWENMTPGAYTASEVKTSRYSLKNVINVEKGIYNSKDKVVNFTIKSNEEGKATFYNVKNTYKDLSHNSIAVNTFKK